MEPVPSPQGIGPPMTGPAPNPAPLPRNILVGFILEALSVVFTGISYGWDFFGIRAVLYPSFVAYIQVQILLATAESLCLQVGLFLIFTGILRWLPRVHPWSRFGPIFILAGALIGTGAELAQAVIIGLTFPPSGATLPEWVSYVESGILISAYVLTALGLLVSLFAVAKGVLLRAAHPPALPQP